MIEVERKFRLSDDKKVDIENQLESDHALSAAFHQMDEVFLLGMDSFAEYKMGMPITRIRVENEVTKLAYKRQLNDKGDMLEHELVVDSADTMRAILLEMGYQSVVCVDKMRRESRLGRATLALDIVRDAGPFLEVEVLAEDEQAIPAAESEIMATAAQFGLTEADIESRKYDQLVTELRKTKV